MMIQTDNMTIETKYRIELLKKRLYEVEDNLRKLEKIEDKGFISSRFKEYCEHLLVLYQCCEEIETFQSLNRLDEFFQSHIDCRKQLDAISELYFADGFRSEYLRNAYKELYLLAENKYDKLNELNFKSN